MWLGAGWYEEEYQAYGYPFPSPKRSVDEFEESLIIYKKVFTEEETNFKGKFWNLVRHRNFPKPIQKPYPQIVIWTTGKRMINIACREADGINLPYLFEQQQKIFLDNISLINGKLKEYDRDPSKFEISLFTSITMVNNQKELESLRRESKILQSELRNQFISTLGDIREKIREFENLGVKKIVITVESPTQKNPLDIFCRKVMFAD